MGVLDNLLSLLVNLTKGYGLHTAGVTSSILVPPTIESRKPGPAPGFLFSAPLKIADRFGNLHDRVLWLEVDPQLRSIGWIGPDQEFPVDQGEGQSHAHLIKGERA